MKNSNIEGKKSSNIGATLGIIIPAILIVLSVIFSVGYSVVVITMAAIIIVVALFNLRFSKKEPITRKANITVTYMGGAPDFVGKKGQKIEVTFDSQNRPIPVGLQMHDGIRSMERDENGVYYYKDITSPSCFHARFRFEVGSKTGAFVGCK